MKNRGKFPILAVAAVLLIAVVLLVSRPWSSVSALQDDGSATRQSAYDDTTNDTDKNTAVVQDGVQMITSSISDGRYEPITVQQGIPVKWTLNMPAGSLNGCNNRIVIPEYDLQISLKEGDNVIEFTPDASGNFAYSCWMGMIRSSITVVRADGTVEENAAGGSDQFTAGCCG